MEKILSLESLAERVSALENQNERFLSALEGAAKMVLENQMVRVMIPLKMRTDLEGYLKARGVQVNGKTGQTEKAISATSSTAVSNK